MKTNLLARTVSPPVLSTLNLAIALGVAITAHLATNIVTSLADSGSGSLSQAIANAAPADTVAFIVTGTITLTSGELWLGKSAAILGPERRL